MSKWEQALQSIGQTKEYLGAAAQSSIGEYQEVLSAIAELKEYENEPDYDVKLVAKLERDLAKLDDKITKQVEGREKQLVNIANMQVARNNKKNVTKADGGATPPIVAEPTPPIVAEPTPPIVAEPSGNGDGGVGWVLAGVGILAAAIFGVNLLKNR